MSPTRLFITFLNITTGWRWEILIFGYCRPLEMSSHDDRTHCSGRFLNNCRCSAAGPCSRLYYSNFRLDGLFCCDYWDSTWATVSTCSFTHYCKEKLTKMVKNEVQVPRTEYLESYSRHQDQQFPISTGWRRRIVVDG